ncbi:MAG: GNAT family N-acetyltransferase [Chloroflexi bacterium]|nr:GNAT family N-acetyltransferase [Chloroflexota bacterium]MCI0579565.1 GNAT family N-acetyltransferase [Chloroflexota bacterium]MCI0646806.1 GNAT family N-acetyltransferase [Chloroflexota bacterium]MCI0727476.1 GNAT family N-acetyltransferase [Chloroflexota bacterium]
MLLERTYTPNIEQDFIVRPAEMGDLEAAYELFKACGDPEVSLEHIRSEWLLPTFDLATTTRLVFTPEGQLVGYIEVWDNANPSVRIWVWGRVHPDYEGLGIGSYLMEWAEQRSRQAIERAPAGSRVVMQAGNHNHNRPGHRLLSDQGMQLIRHSWTMKIELDTSPPAPQWPAGVTVRPMRDEAELRAIVHAVRDSFQDHWGYLPQPFEEEFERWQHFMRQDEHFDPSLWFLAMDGEEIAGVSLCHAHREEDPDMGWVGTLGVRRPWRRQGLGLALLQYSFGEFYRRGKARVGLGVDAGSLTGATRLYQKAGMHVARQFDLYEKELRPGKELTTQSLNERADS